jgi:hypothetical protein
MEKGSTGVDWNFGGFLSTNSPQSFNSNSPLNSGLNNTFTTNFAVNSGSAATYTSAASFLAAK